MLKLMHARATRWCPAPFPAFRATSGEEVGRRFVIIPETVKIMNGRNFAVNEPTVFPGPVSRLSLALNQA
jgi:hypothetical protein